MIYNGKRIKMLKGESNMKELRKFIYVLFLFFISCNTNTQVDKMEILKKANDNYEKNYLKDALELYNDYVKLDSTLGVAYFNKSHCEAMLFDYENSIKSLKKSIELNYRVVDANYNIARSYAATYNDSLALYYFKEAYKLDSTDMDIKEQIEIFTHRLNR